MARFGRLPNRFFRLVAAWLPGFAVIVHRGRRSGHIYQTPVKLFREEGCYLVACVYGIESDWVRNVLAARGCELVNHGRHIVVSGATVVHDETQRSVPWFARAVFRLLRVAEFVRLDPSTSPSRFTVAPPDGTGRLRRA